MFFLYLTQKCQNKNLKGMNDKGHRIMDILRREWKNALISIM